MKSLIIRVAVDFTDAPGARNISDGENSGEEFYNTHLLPKFQRAINEKTKLLVDLDDSWGYASSFISGSFGRLADKFGKQTVLSVLEFKSEDDSSLIEKIIAEVNKTQNDG